MNEGLDTINQKMNINSIRNKILMLCPSFDKIDVLMGDKTSTNPPLVSNSTNGMDVKDIFFEFPS
jgi:hypothetical protein